MRYNNNNIWESKTGTQLGVSLRFPFAYILGNYLTEEQLMEVEEYSEVLNIPNNFLESYFLERFVKIIAYAEGIENSECMMRYIWKINFYNTILLIEVLLACFM